MIFKKFKEPNEKTVEFVGFYIDKIHELDWPENYGSKEYTDFFKKLPEKQRFLWATWILQMEVDNGGHSQYFFNLPDDSYLQECEKGLHELKASKVFAILQKAKKLICRHQRDVTGVLDWKGWIDHLDKFDLRKKLWKLDSQFFKQSYDYYELRKKFILKNFTDFEPLKNEKS